MEMLAPFAFTKIVIIQSLEPHEYPTGKLLHAFLDQLTMTLGRTVPIEFHTCESAVSFRKIIESLIEDGRFGHIPLLHVESHGDEHCGLEFENGSELDWHTTAELLSRLNVACEYNLLATFAACFGAYFLGAIRAEAISPCYAMVAPTSKVAPDELERGFKLFYGEILRTLDAGVSLRRLRAERLSHGYWFGETAESWFERVVVGYVVTHCTRKALKSRVRILYRKLLREGNRQSIGSLKRVALRRSRREYFPDYFDQFFAVNSIPENKLRFRPLYQRTKRKLENIWLSPEYRQ
jgi:hypothetical protein